MTTKKKTAARAANPADAPEERVFDEPTAVYFAYSPHANTIRVTVNQDAEIMGENRRHGVDKEIRISELPKDVQKDLENLLGILADECGVASYHD